MHRTTLLRRFEKRPYFCCANIWRRYTWSKNASLSCHIKLTQARFPGKKSSKVLFPVSIHQRAKHAMQKRIKIVKAYFVTKSIVQTKAQFRRDVPGRNAPNRLTIKRLLDKLKEMGSVQDNIKGRGGRPRPARTEKHRRASPRKSKTFSGRDLSRSSVMGSYLVIFVCLRIKYRFHNFRPMQIRLRDVPLGKPSVSESKTNLISWTSFFSVTGQNPISIVT